MIKNYFLLISHTLERKNSHSNQFYCKKTPPTTALRRKSKSFHFCNELLLSVPNPCIQNSLLSALPMFSAALQQKTPAFSRVSTVFNNSRNSSAAAYDQHFWLKNQHECTTKIRKARCLLLSFLSLSAILLSENFPSFFLRNTREIELSNNHKKKLDQFKTNSFVMMDYVK